MMGGNVGQQAPTQLSSTCGAPPTNGGCATVNHMFVELMAPETVAGLPVVMLHGTTLSGAS